CTSLRYSLSAPACNRNLVTIRAAGVVESRSKAFLDRFRFFEALSKGIKVCLADVTIRQIVKTRRGFSGSALALSRLLQCKKRNQRDGHRNDCDAQLNGSVHF